jgi:hypothetical protein
MKCQCFPKKNFVNQVDYIFAEWVFQTRPRQREPALCHQWYTIGCEWSLNTWLLTLLGLLRSVIYNFVATTIYLLTHCTAKCYVLYITCQRLRCLDIFMNKFETKLISSTVLSCWISRRYNSLLIVIGRVLLLISAPLLSSECTQAAMTYKNLICS